MHDLVPLTLVVPLLVAAALAATVSFHPRRPAEIAATATATAVAVLAAVLAVRSFGEPLVHWIGGWEPDGGVVLGIDLVVDPFAGALAALAATLTAATFVFGWRYFSALPQTLFHVLMVVFLAAMVGFVFSGDLFNLFVFFELMTVAAIVLTSYMNEERAPLQGQINFAVTNTIGAFLLLTGIALVYAETGALNLAQIGETLAGREPRPVVIVAFALIVAGFFVKAAVVPFHFWLADAYAVAPAPICVLFSGAMSELGIYGVMRVYWTSFEGALGAHAEGLRWILVIAGAATAVTGATMAIQQLNMKRLLAFATVAHVGLFLVAAALLTPEGLAGAAVWTVADGFVKGALFMCVGILAARLGSVDDVDLHGLGRSLPATAVLYLVGALAIMTAPPFGTFLGKSLAEESAAKEGFGWIPYLFAAVSAVVGAAVLKAGARVFLGWGTAERDAGDHDEGDDAEEEGGEPTSSRERRTPVWMLAPPAALLAGALALGLAPEVDDWATHAAASFQHREAYAAAVLAGEELAVPSVEPAAPKAKDVVLSLLAVAAAIPLAALAVVRRRLPLFPRGRALHSGHVGDYVTWVVVGTVAFGAAFALVLR